MALPNYSPSGTILFGSVPWGDDYSNVRLYGSLEEQYSDIASLMTINTSNYSYVARERRLKVSIEADRLYHCNYCMYRNDSLTDGWIYCFVSNVTYVNDNTSEVDLETDIFQTYLYNVDWTLPACFVERETSADDSSFNPYVSEPDFSLTYTRNESTRYMFDAKGVVVMTSAEPAQGILEEVQVWNEDAYYAEPVNPNIYFGVCNGATFHYYSLDDLQEGDDGDEEHMKDLRTMIRGLNAAGSIESIVSIFTVPSFAVTETSAAGQQLSVSVFQDDPSVYQAEFQAPGRGERLNGYVPRNNKLFCYPYNYLRLSDYNGSETELRYELLPSTGSDSDTRICIKYRASPTCQAYVYPYYYSGASGYYFGFPTNCGAQGSWSSSYFQSWLQQNAMNIAITLAGVALAAYTGGTSLAASSSAMRLSQRAAAAWAKRPSEAASTLASNLATKAAAEKTKGMVALGAGAALGANQAAQVYAASKSPVTNKGQTSYNNTFMTGMQGVHAERMSVVSDIAEQIDDYFDQWGYAVEEVKAPNITSRPSWNFLKTGGCAPRSANVAAGASAPFSRGRGTPADVLKAIKETIDGGVTFWHTTSGFGDYSLANK